MMKPESSSQPSDGHALPHEPRFYVPRHAGWKLVICACGVVILAFGLYFLWPPLRLAIWGMRAQAVATRVVESRPGLPDVFLDSDAQIQTRIDAHDGAATFWNLFSFQANDGRTIVVRDNIGSRLKPLDPIVDTEGLPTTATVYYDAGQPQSAIFPGEMSTWLTPVVVTLAGLACAVISATLFYWADKPIELPEIPPAATTAEPVGV
jgi:hypothetical protein